jgi:hypothetical protein
MTVYDEFYGEEAEKRMRLREALQSADSIAKLMNICLPGMTSVNGSSAGRTGACRKKRRNVNAR